jgi:hypothetical protein
MMATHVSDLSAPLGSGDGQGLRDTGGALGALSHALRSIPLAIDATLEGCATIAVPVVFFTACTTEDSRGSSRRAGGRVGSSSHISGRGGGNGTTSGRTLMVIRLSLTSGLRS